jgi:hypothetical protein
MSDKDAYIQELEARIEELEGIIDTYVADNADGCAWMVVDTTTGLFWRGGMGSNNFSKTGKVYPKAAHLKNALRNHCHKPDSYFYKKYGGYKEYTKKWQVVETATIVTKRYSLKEFLGD